MAPLRLRASAMVVGRQRDGMRVKKRLERSRRLHLSHHCFEAPLVRVDAQLLLDVIGKIKAFRPRRADDLLHQISLPIWSAGGLAASRCLHRPSGVPRWVFRPQGIDRHVSRLARKTDDDIA